MEGSDALGLVGSVGSAVPYVGPIISLAASIGSGVLKNKEAGDQAKRAEELRKKSENLQKGALRPEYTKALRADQMAALYGLPGYDTYLENIDEGVANNARSIVESSPNGAATLAALSATVNQANRTKEDLFVKNADAMEVKRAKANQTLWNTGDKQMDLVGMQRADKRDLNQGAMNLENAATANKIGSIDQILASIGAGASTIGKITGNGTVGASGKTATPNTVTASTGTNGGGLMNSDIYNLQNTTATIPPIPSFKNGNTDDATLASVMAFLKQNPQFNSQWNN